MVAFTYVSPRDKVKSVQDYLKDLDATEAQNEVWAARAQAELANPNITPERRAQMNMVLNYAELNRQDIANNRSINQAIVDDLGNQIENDSTEKINAGNATEYREFEESGSLGDDEQVYLRDGNTDDEEPGSYDNAFNEDEYGEGGEDLLGSDDYGDDYSGGDQSISPGGDNTTGKNKKNPLDAYPNYTYGLSLHALTLEKYNNIVEGGSGYAATSGEVLIASGGRRDQQLSRNPLFGKDMYFDSCKIQTVIGHNATTRASNVVVIEMSVIELYSITFIQKLVQVANQNNIRSWDQMPFVLQIDFFANQEDGSLVGPIADLTKLLVIKIIEIKAKLGPKGTEYQIRAVPASHVAMQQTVGTTPVNYEVLSKTIGEFFDGNRSGGESSSFESRDAEAQDGGFYGSNTPSKSNAIKTYSFATALNNYQKLLVKRKHQKLADEYKFVIDGDISDKKIIFKPKQNPLANTGAQNDNNNKQNIDLEKGLFRVNAGTSILEVINHVLRSSEYYAELIEEQPSEGIGNEPLRIHKILTTVKYNAGKWDSIRKVYQKTITFYVKTFQYYNTKFMQSKRALPNKWSKEYDYIYTGKNQDILNLDIDFNVMFFVAITAYEQKNQAGTVSEKDEEQDKEDAVASGESGTVQNLRTNTVSQHTQETSQATNVTKKQVEANDLYKSIMSSSRGDMVNVKMKVAGDPDFIKQDDVFYPPGGGSGSSISMDQHEVFVKLRFRTPDDINQDTGLYNFASDGENTFSGLYKIITVENHFERGMFYQNLDMVRLFEQPDDAVGGGGGGSPMSAVDPRDAIRGQRGYDLPPEAQAAYDSERMAAQGAARDAIRGQRGYGEEDPNNFVDYYTDPGDSSVAGIDFATPDSGLVAAADQEPREANNDDFYLG